jgi:adenine-specific DNA glycosylase
VCRAQRPLHEQCPVANRCSWWQAELAKLKESASLLDGKLEAASDQRAIARFIYGKVRS